MCAAREVRALHRVALVEERLEDRGREVGSLGIRRDLLDPAASLGGIERRGVASDRDGGGDQLAPQRAGRAAALERHRDRPAER
jgi:hypothetical protein